MYFKCERCRRDATEGLYSPKTNTKMPTRTKNVKMNQAVTNTEIYLHSCLCESRGIKVGRSSHRRCSIKTGVLKNFAKLTGKHLCQSLFFDKGAGVTFKRLQHRCFSARFVKFLRTPFLQKTSGRLLLNNLDCQKM